MQKITICNFIVILYCILCLVLDSFFSLSQHTTPQVLSCFNSICVKKRIYIYLCCRDKSTFKHSIIMYKEHSLIKQSLAIQKKIYFLICSVFLAQCLARPQLKSLRQKQGSQQDSLLHLNHLQRQELLFRFLSAAGG